MSSRTSASRRGRTRTTLACFGEALWDVLPNGMFPGGAPLNVAYHLRQHGVDVRLLSAVGRDFLGDEILRRLEQWNVDGSHVARLAKWPTGIVRASVDEHGVPTYSIERRVAWDHIPVDSALRKGSQTVPAAVVFGTLALRGPSNRKSLDALISAWPATLRVVDLNLRPPFVSRQVVLFSLRRAHVLKLSDSELGTISTLPVRTQKELARAARLVSRIHGIPRVCVTAGPKGAGLLWDDAWVWEPGRTVKVQDTIGAGDAFLAALLSAILQDRAAPKQALAAACRMGEFVASKAGATPAY